MVISCSAINCNNRQNCGKIALQFHRFPIKNEILCKKWMLAVRRSNWTPTRYSRICGEHFTDNDYKTKCKQYLKPHAVPSIFNFHKPQTDSDVDATTSIECSTSTYGLVKYDDRGMQTKKIRGSYISLSYQDKETQTKYKECPIMLRKLRRKAKLIQQRILRREVKISNLEDILGYLTNTCDIPESEFEKLDEMFGDVLLEIQMNWRVNKMGRKN